MIRFTEEEIKSFRERKEKDEILSQLKEKASAFLSFPLTIPETGCADWSHYYYCPDCSVKLVFDPLSPEDHVCPTCGKHFSDEKKNGAWWRLMNSFNEDGANANAEIYLLTEDEDALAVARNILLGYAKYYPEYIPHGDIPYNGPGKLNAQTLDEANFLRNLAYAYDIIRDAISPEEREYIETRLFREGMEFLKANRHSQIHNHEVICNGAIGVLALILGDKESLDFALRGKYGLVYQLEHGTLEDGFWFECSTAYHFYAFQNFMLYEKFAQHTEYSNLGNPAYLKMLESILRIEKSDGSFPLLNDAHPEQGDRDGYGLYEFAYKTWKSKTILKELNRKYRTEKRLSPESFFYGVPVLSECSEEITQETLVGENGLGASVIRKGPLYLLFRHGPYGGEHDHYDRLGISYYYDNVPVSIDMGTTGYGAILHYDYYKNTPTHNTVSINEGNQPPSAGRLLSFEEHDGRVRVKASAEWVDDYPMPDSFTIKQWDDESYRHAYMERLIDVGEDAVFDVFRVRAENASELLYSFHFHGERIYSDSVEPMEALSSRKPLCHLDSWARTVSDTLHTAYVNKGVHTDVYSYVPSGEIITASGPDNPSSMKMSYVIGKTDGKEAVFASLISSGYGRSYVTDAVFSVENGKVRAEAVMADGRKVIFTE